MKGKGFMILIGIALLIISSASGQSAYPCDSDSDCPISICAKGACDMLLRECFYFNENNLACDDGDPCTIDWCTSIWGNCIHVEIDPTCEEGVNDVNCENYCENIETDPAIDPDTITVCYPTSCDYTESYYYCIPATMECSVLDDRCCPGLSCQKPPEGGAAVCLEIL